MRFFSHRLFLFLLAACIFLPGSFCLAEDTKWSSDLAAWREEHVSDLRKPAGWLSLTGLDWLQTGDNTFGSAADNKIRLVDSPAHLGVLHLENDTVQLLPPKGGDFPPELLIAGAAARTQLIPVAADSDKDAPHFTIGSLNMYVIRRADRFALRVDRKSTRLNSSHLGI